MIRLVILVVFFAACSSSYPLGEHPEEIQATERGGSGENAEAVESNWPHMCETSIKCRRDECMEEGQFAGSCNGTFSWLKPHRQARLTVLVRPGRKLCIFRPMTLRVTHPSHRDHLTSGSCVEPRREDSRNLTLIVLPSESQQSESNPFSRWRPGHFRFRQVPVEEHIEAKPVKIILQDRVPARLLRAIRKVETGDTCDRVVLCLLGMKRNAGLGPYQINRQYYRDAVNFKPELKRTPYAFVVLRDFSEKIIQAYMSRYANRLRLGYLPTNQDFSRIHHGGPNGHLDPRTIPYWERVKKQLNTYG